MAAITTGQEDAEQQQNVPPKRKPRTPKGESAGKTPQRVEVSHAALERDIHTRHWAEQALAGRTLTLRGTQIHIEPPINLGGIDSPPWSGNEGELDHIELFTDTSKMGAPSYSLPVGPPSYGGSCPGSFGGMTTAAPAMFKQQRAVVLKVLNDTNPKMRSAIPGANYDPAYSVCQNCYVSKGNHALYYGNNLRIVTRFAWTRAAVESGQFAPSIIEALKHVQFAAEPAALAHLHQRYFRIHDAGDFYSEKYLAAWHEIAKAYDGQTAGQPRTVFWAPTRIWVTPKGNEWVKRINGGANFLDNLVIRPSGYIINAPGPDFEIGRATGYASPTTVDTKPHVEAVLTGKAPPSFDWLCPAQEFGGSCLESPNPDGSRGCRVCWVHPQLRTSYKLH